MVAISRVQMIYSENTHEKLKIVIKHTQFI